MARARGARCQTIVPSIMRPAGKAAPAVSAAPRWRLPPGFEPVSSARRRRTQPEMLVALAGAGRGAPGPRQGPEDHGLVLETQHPALGRNKVLAAHPGLSGIPVLAAREVRRGEHVLGNRAAHTGHVAVEAPNRTQVSQLQPEISFKKPT